MIFSSSRCARGSSRTGTMGSSTNLGYNEAREQMYGFVDASGGQIACIYTGFQQASGFVTYPNPINAEHVVPQSFYWLCIAHEIRHLVHPALPRSANSARSNDPYGEVADGSAQWYGVDGSGDYLSTGSRRPTPMTSARARAAFGSPERSSKGTWPGVCSISTPCIPRRRGTSQGVATRKSSTTGTCRIRSALWNRPGTTEQRSPKATAIPTSTIPTGSTWLVLGAAHGHSRVHVGLGLQL